MLGGCCWGRGCRCYSADVEGRRVVENPFLDDRECIVTGREIFGTEPEERRSWGGHCGEMSHINRDQVQIGVLGVGTYRISLALASTWYYQDLSEA